MSKLLLAAVVSMLLAVAAAGQGTPVSAADKSAIAGVWNDIISAAQKKDRRALEQIFAEDFFHVHAKGKIDDRKARLDAILSGEATIDTAGKVEFGFRQYGDTIVAVGAIKTTDGGRPVTYAVTRVYVKQKGRWVFASSHASSVMAEQDP